MKVNEHKFYFDKKLADAIAEQYQYLIGQTFPLTLGASTIEAPIDKVAPIQIEEDSYEVILYSDLNNISFREMYMVMNLNSYSLLDYLEHIGEQFPFEKFGIDYTQLLSKRDKK